MIKSEFEAQCADLEEMLSGLSDDAAGNIACVNAHSQMLLAEAIVDLTAVLRRKNGEDDVELTDDDEAALQAEVHGAGAIDPTVLVEDTGATLDERHFINKGLLDSHDQRVR